MPAELSGNAENDSAQPNLREVIYLFGSNAALMVRRDDHQASPNHRRQRSDPEAHGQPGINSNNYLFWDTRRRSTTGVTHVFYNVVR